MRLNVLLLVVAAGLFVLSAVPKVRQAWMIPIGLALMACSFVPWFNRVLQ